MLCQLTKLDHVPEELKELNDSVIGVLKNMEKKEQDQIKQADMIKNETNDFIDGALKEL